MLTSALDGQKLIKQMRKYINADMRIQKIMKESLRSNYTLMNHVKVRNISLCFEYYSILVVISFAGSYNSLS